MNAMVENLFQVMRKCKTCGEIKDEEEFYFGGRLSKSKCGDCALAAKRKYNADNLERVVASKRKHYLANKENIKQRTNKHYRENKEHHKAYKKDWRRRNRVEIAAKQAARYRENKAEVIERNMRNERRRWRTEPRFRLNKLIAHGIRESLKNGKGGKHWEELLGYTLDDLYEHLESKFKPGMTWDNYGCWHIDHIRPKASFSYQSADDKGFVECWALDNLQPLWAAENIRKSDSLCWGSAEANA